jgi:hypothetical protein
LVQRGLRFSFSFAIAGEAQFFQCENVSGSQGSFWDSNRRYDILKTRVTVAGSDGPKTEHQPDDIRLEAVSILSDDKSAIFCSVTIAAKGITERVLYSVGPTGNPGSYGNSWIVKFGGDLGPSGGGHELFPEMIQVQPSKGPKP